MTHFQTIDVVTLTQVNGGQQRPAPPTPPRPPQQSRPPQQPQPADETRWIRNTVRCARVGGPVLGALCGILTPTPAT